ncbi:hypothetical protein [Pseudohoeflea coraliihabitans]|uniref:SAM-dependent methyltransferase n=1 Tax=Pseudohoeflea coraliihabitans TaxID=2860393 RepID=A0ABS6WLJ3_9HYPH|nr:hypothetical protein [Pseudohoeflea sp. DP4N28-3]MBW3096832.1 hypothetical protein [Pseudohoeflea sp. DP4N28-3]
MSKATSARGLFRATGNKARPVKIQTEDGIVAADALPRERDDFYPTPPEPTRAILSAEGPRLRDFPLIWEPAAGDGAMVREMAALGFSAHASDLIDRGCGAEIRSFYDFPEAPAKAILTNPPFQECNWRDGRGRWIRHALEVLGVEYMALLLSWSFPGAGGLGTLWAQYPPARVYLMRWKIDFTGQGAPPMLNGWFVWDRAHEGETVLRMLDRVDSRQSELFGEAAE